MNARRTAAVVGLLLAALALMTSASTPAQADPPAGQSHQTWVTKVASEGGNGTLMRAQ